MSGIIRHIVFALAISFIFFFTFSGRGTTVSAATTVSPHLHPCFTCFHIQDQSGKSDPVAIKKKPRPSICKINIQRWAVIAERTSGQSPDYLLAGTSEDVEQGVLVSFVQYLPRDPPHMSA